jgi:hypothetical protein
VTLRLSRPRSFSHFLVDSSSSRSSSGLGCFLCMKLQKPPRTHPSPLLSLQQASRKSVTGDSSQYMGLAAYQREFSASHACCAESSYLNRAYTLPIRSSLARQLSSHSLTHSLSRASTGRLLTVVVVVAHHNLLDLAKLAHLAPKVLVEGVEVVL